MTRRTSLRSRVVMGLKIGMPLAALVLLSTVFLFSSGTEPIREIPFADAGLQDRATRQQVTAPFFSATTAGGDVLSVRAQSARPDPNRDGVAYAERLDATLGLTDGSRITLRSDTAEVDEPGDTAILQGNVLVTSTTGYDLRSDRLIAALRQVRVESPGPVSGQGPIGSFTAGGMVIEGDSQGENIQMLFIGGVKMIYDPRDQKD